MQDFLMRFLTDSELQNRVMMRVIAVPVTLGVAYVVALIIWH